jgi:hypothetical protein
MPELSLSLPPPACNELDVPQEEPGGRIVQASGSQGDRRAPSTVARDDESPMNSHKCSEISVMACTCLQWGVCEARSVIDRRGSRRRGDSVWTGH